MVRQPYFASLSVDLHTLYVQEGSIKSVGSILIVKKTSMNNGFCSHNLLDPICLCDELMFNRACDNFRFEIKIPIYINVLYRDISIIRLRRLIWFCDHFRKVRRCCLQSDGTAA